jgi:aspartate aminotransferase
MKFSDRILNTPSSPIRKFAPLEKSAVERGVEVFKLNIGQPDLHTPQKILKSFRKFKTDIVLYAPSAGLPETIEAWRTYYHSHGLHVEPEEIIITSGGSEALMFAIMAACDPNDEIIVFEPFYTNFAGFAAIADVNLVPVNLTIDNGFALPDIEVIKSKITDKTKAIILNNPNNPTGVVYSRQEIQKIVNLCFRHDLFLISDEVYREFIFDETPHVSVLNFPEIADRAIVIDSVSKRFNHCGGRVGCFVSRNRELMAQVLKIAQARLSVPTLEQLSVIPLLTKPREYTDSVKEEYRKRRNVVVSELAKISGAKFIEPKGAFYIMVELPVDDAEDLVKFLLTDFSDNNQTVMVTPAQGFYMTLDAGKKQIRIAYVLDEKKLKRAVELLRLGVEKYNSL